MTSALPFSFNFLSFNQNWYVWPWRQGLTKLFSIVSRKCLQLAIYHTTGQQLLWSSTFEALQTRFLSYLQIILLKSKSLTFFVSRALFLLQRTKNKCFVGIHDAVFICFQKQNAWFGNIRIIVKTVRILLKKLREISESSRSDCSSSEYSSAMSFTANGVKN